MERTGLNLSSTHDYTQTQHNINKEGGYNE